MSDVLTQPVPPTPATGDIAMQLERYRVELTGYCYRMLGSAFEAEDAVQETFVRAWNGFAKFEGRAAIRSWLYRIATNVCLNMLGAPQRRARPMDLGPARTADSQLGSPLPENHWVEPMPDGRPCPPAATLSTWPSRASRSAWRSSPLSSICRRASGQS